MESEIYFFKSEDFTKRINRALCKLRELRDESRILRSEIKYWRKKQEQLNNEAFKTK